MKCTECNRTIKPVVAVDIDGTMGMYHKHFLDFASNYLNQQVKDHYVSNQPFKEWFCSNYRVTTDVWHDIKLAYRQGGMKRTMPVYPDARELCQSIQKAGAELWVTTTRPYIRHDNIDPDTREWLRRHHIPYDYLIYDGHKYKKLAQLVGRERVCAVLDDLLEETSEAEVMFGDWVPIMRKQPFNKATTWRTEATNLQMASRLIDDRIKRWRELHEQEPIPSDGRGHPTESSEQIPGEVN
jgi:5'(3')-deoxyribonucleotidase